GRTTSVGSARAGRKTRGTSASLSLIGASAPWGCPAYSASPGRGGLKSAPGARAGAGREEERGKGRRNEFVRSARGRGAGGRRLRDERGGRGAGGRRLRDERGGRGA